MIRTGISLRSSYPVDDPRLGARWMVERARAAREAGLDSLFVGDHHVTGPQVYYQNSPILGRLLAEWGDAPAGALYLLPLWPPVLLAEQVGTLAAIARGRFILQCALGGDAGQFAGMGADLRRRPSRFERNLSVVRRLLAGEEVDGPPAGGSEEPAKVLIAPVPAEPVDVWIGGGALPAIDRAARLGDGWIAGPEVTDEEAAGLLNHYREACARHGRSAAVAAIRRDIHVGADTVDARRVAEPVLARGYRGFDPAACVVGGPEEVAGRFAGYARLGFTDVIVRHLADGQDDVVASISRLAEVRRLLAG